MNTYCLKLRLTGLQTKHLIHSGIHCFATTEHRGKWYIYLRFEECHSIQHVHALSFPISVHSFASDGKHQQFKGGKMQYKSASTEKAHTFSVPVSVYCSPLEAPAGTTQRHDRRFSSARCYNTGRHNSEGFTHHGSKRYVLVILLNCDRCNVFSSFMCAQAQCPGHIELFSRSMAYLWSTEYTLSTWYSTRKPQGQVPTNNELSNKVRVCKLHNQYHKYSALVPACCLEPSWALGVHLYCAVPAPQSCLAGPPAPQLPSRMHWWCDVHRPEYRQSFIGTNVLVLE